MDTRFKMHKKILNSLPYERGPEQSLAEVTSTATNLRSMMTHRPAISCFPIRSVQTASPFSSQVRHDASPIGMGLSGASRTPIEPGTSPYRIGPFWLMWAKHRGMRLTDRSHV